MRLPLAASAVVASTLAVGCSGDGGAAITDGGTWLDTYVGRLCAKAHACRESYGTGAGPTFEEAWGTDAADCRLRFPSAAEVRDAVAGGTCAFDADAGESCLSDLAYEQESCEAFWAGTDPDVCSGVLVGLVGAGGACESGLECAPGLVCTDGRCGGAGATSSERRGRR